MEIFNQGSWLPVTKVQSSSIPRVRVHFVINNGKSEPSHSDLGYFFVTQFRRWFTLDFHRNFCLFDQNPTKFSSFFEDLSFTKNFWLSFNNIFQKFTILPNFLFSFYLTY